MTREFNKEELHGFQDKSVQDRTRISHLLLKEAEKNPEEVIDSVAWIEAHLDDDNSTVKKNLLVALTRVAGSYPEEVYPITPKLREIISEGLEDKDTDTDILTTALSSYGLISGSYPNLSENNIDLFVKAARHENKFISNNGLAAISEISSRYQDELIEHLDLIIEKLSSEDQYTRSNSILAIARLAENHPDRIQRDVGINRISSLLREELPQIRRGACIALGNLGIRAKETKPMLRERRKNDESPNVRDAARNALDKM